MEIILFTLALVLLLMGGCGLVLLTIPPARQTPISEALCLAFPLGAGLVSLSYFIFGFLLTGLALRLTIAALCIALLIAGWRRNKLSLNRRSILPDDRQGWLLLTALIALISAAFLFSNMRTLGWDGLLNWEIKARIAFLSDGAIPLKFYSDPTRPWTHQEYPLLLPLTEAWMYSWMGSADQGLIKILFPIFFVASLGLLFSAVSRHGAPPRVTTRLWLALALLASAKMLLLGEGSISSGYADFPTAVFYLGAVTLLFEFCEDGAQDPAQGGVMDVAWLFGLVAGFLCWIKAEGAILWGGLVSLAVVNIIRRRAWPKLIPTILPGLILVIGWRVFLLLVNRSTGQDFLPVTPATFRNNLWRAPQIALAVLQELLRWSRWGILWLAVATVTLFLIYKRHRGKDLILSVTVILPILLYASVYIFSAWDFLTHIDNSFPRLLSQVSLAAVLMVAIDAPISRGELRRRS